MTRAGETILPRRRSVATLAAERERQFEGVIDVAKLFSHDVSDGQTYRDLHRRALPADPERKLMAAVILSAVDIVLRYDAFRERPQFYFETVYWLSSNDRRWPFFFVPVCEALNLEPGYVRRLVQAELERRRVNPQTTAQRGWSWALRQVKDWTTDRLSRGISCSSSTARNLVTQWQEAGDVELIERRTGRHGFAKFRVAKRAEVG